VGKERQALRQMDRWLDGKIKWFLYLISSLMVQVKSQQISDIDI
jgi:hypothetical protein